MGMLEINDSVKIESERLMRFSKLLFYGSIFLSGTSMFVSRFSAARSFAAIGVLALVGFGSMSLTRQNSQLDNWIDLIGVTSMLVALVSLSAYIFFMPLV